MESSDMDRVVALCPILDVAWGTPLTRAEGLGNQMAVLLEGEAVVEVDGLDVCSLGEESTVGELAVAGDHLRPLTVRANAPCRLMVVSEDALATLREEGHPFAAEVERLALVTLARVLLALDRQLLQRHDLATPEWPAERRPLRERLVALVGGAWAPSVELDPQEVLTQCELFEDLGEETLSVLGEQMTALRYAAGHVVFMQGQLSGGVYVLVQGAVDAAVTTIDGEVKLLGSVGRGELFGVTSLVQGRPHAASCVTREATTVLTMEADAWRRLVASDSEASDGLRIASMRALGRVLVRARSALHHHLVVERQLVVDEVAPLRAQGAVDVAKELGHVAYGEE